MNNKTITTKPVKMTTDSSSKGNQPKWYGDGLWYKADHMGYEGLSEIVISKLLAKTNIRNFVTYLPTFIEYEGKKLVGCYSETFKKDNETIYTLEKLFRAYTGQSLAKALLDYPEVKAKPFDADFDLQMDSAEELYGIQLTIGFTENDIINSVEECKEYYDEAIRNRVKNVLLARKNKFRYLVATN